MDLRTLNMEEGRALIAVGDLASRKEPRRGSFVARIRTRILANNDRLYSSALVTNVLASLLDKNLVVRQGGDVLAPNESGCEVLSRIKTESEGNRFRRRSETPNVPVIRELQQA